MFKEYYFVWTDYETQDELFDLIGDDYTVFLDVCFKYSHYFLFHYNPRYVSIPNDIMKEAIQTSDLPLFRIPPYCFDCYSNNTLCLALTPAVKEWIRNVTTGLMNWNCIGDIKNPEDPVFLRNDYSVFFKSIIHEADCTLCVKKDEDISEILKTGLWVADKNLLP